MNKREELKQKPWDQYTWLKMMNSHRAPTQRSCCEWLEPWQTEAGDVRTVALQECQRDRRVTSFGDETVNASLCERVPSRSASARSAVWLELGRGWSCQAVPSAPGSPEEDSQTQVSLYILENAAW